MRQILILTVFGICLGGAADRAAAWGNEGHRAIARIAADHLTPGAKAQVQVLLAGETEADLPGISSWADEVRPERRETAAWHFVNFEGSCSYDAARVCAGGNCAVGAIRHFAEILADPAQPAPARNEALKFVVHFVGDLHQPFHDGPNHDKGGNAYQIHIDGKDRGTNLHHVWDTEMVEAIDHNWRQIARELDPDPGAPIEFARGADFAPEAWAQAACTRISVEHLYPDGHEIGEGYVIAHKNVAQEQIRLAGERLAAVLNYSLGHLK